jgi:hypothetical protein
MKKIKQILRKCKKGLQLLMRFIKKPSLTKQQVRERYARTHEIRKSFGKEMPDKTFYIIGTDEGWCGLFAIIAHQLTHIAYAVERGYAPIVDLQNFNNQYLGKKEKFKENAWEYFFQQPLGYGLNDINKAQNVIQSVFYPDPPDKKYRISYATTIYDTDAIAYWREIFQKYVRFNQSTENFIQSKYNELLKNKERVLGVLCRGTDYTTLKPHNHPIQPEPIEVIERTKKAMEEWNCDYIYLATEDADIYDLFVKHFADKLILDDANRWRTTDLSNGKSIADLFSDKLEKYNDGVKYLSQIYLLSQCTCFIAGSTRGSLGVLLMSNGFEKYYIYNLGAYK